MGNKQEKRRKGDIWEKKNIKGCREREKKKKTLGCGINCANIAARLCEFYHEGNKRVKMK